MLAVGFGRTDLPLALPQPEWDREVEEFYKERDARRQRGKLDKLSNLTPDEKRQVDAFDAREKHTNREG